MKIDDKVRVELDDDDIREAVEQHVRIKLSTGPETQKLKLTELRIFDPSAVQMEGEEPRTIDYGLTARLQFEPVAKPVTRG